MKCVPGVPYWLPIVGAMVLIALPAQAQELGRLGDVESEGASYHVFARPGEATVQVLVIGTARSDGIYEVGEGTALDELMALVGGPALGARERRQRREVNVRLYRQEGGRRVLLYEASLEEMLVEPTAHPMLQDGDVFTVEIVEWSRFRYSDLFRFLTNAAVIYVAVDRIVRTFR